MKFKNKIIMSLLMVGSFFPIFGASRIKNVTEGALDALRRQYKGEAFRLSAEEGSLLAAGGWNKVYFWNTKTGRLLKTTAVSSNGFLVGRPATGKGIALSKDGSKLAYATVKKDPIEKHFIVVLDTSTEDNELHLQSPGLVKSFAFSKDGNTLFTASYENYRRGIIMKWNVKTGALLGDTKSIPDFGHVRDIALSGDGRTLVAAVLNDVILFDSRTLEKRLTLSGHEGYVNTVACSSDGKIASQGNDGKVKVWASNGELLYTFEQDPGGAHGCFGLAFSPDGSKIAAAGYHARINVWNANNGNTLLTIDEEREYAANNCILAVAFSSDGNVIFSAISGIDHGAIRLRSTENGNLLNTFKLPKGSYYRSMALQKGLPSGE